MQVWPPARAVYRAALAGVREAKEGAGEGAGRAGGAHRHRWAAELGSGIPDCGEPESDRRRARIPARLYVQFNRLLMESERALRPFVMDGGAVEFDMPSLIITVQKA